MNKKKGMSQTLTLIVTASVLMMTALTVGVLGRTTILGTGEDTRKDACLQAVRSSCEAVNAAGGRSTPRPAKCDDVPDTAIKNLANVGDARSNSIICTKP